MPYYILREGLVGNLDPEMVERRDAIPFILVKISGSQGKEGGNLNVSCPLHTGVQFKRKPRSSTTFKRL